MIGPWVEGDNDCLVCLWGLVCCVHARATPTSIAGPVTTLHTHARARSTRLTCHMTRWETQHLALLRAAEDEALVAAAKAGADHPVPRPR